MKLLVSTLTIVDMSFRVLSCLKSGEHAARVPLNIEFQLTWAAALPCTRISTQTYGGTDTAVPYRTSVCGSGSCYSPIRGV